VELHLSRAKFFLFIRVYDPGGKIEVPPLIVSPFDMNLLTYNGRHAYHLVCDSPFVVIMLSFAPLQFSPW